MAGISEQEVVPPFVPFQKIPRLFREVIVTEKIDGTNASVTVTEDGRVLAGSRNRYVTPEDDNHGFAAWVRVHKDDLREHFGLGTVNHGEWWGSGIGRGYGLKEKRFSLFNVSRWGDDGTMVRPLCCHVVPVLWKGKFNTEHISWLMANMVNYGSFAVPGFMKPEGIVVYHAAGNVLFKATIEKDEEPKGKG
jgi:hypothetical protein